MKSFNTLLVQHFNLMKITITWKAVPNEVASSRRVTSLLASSKSPGQTLGRISPRRKSYLIVPIDVVHTSMM